LPKRLKATLAVVVESFDRKGKVLSHKVVMNDVGVAEGSAPLTPSQPTITMSTVVPTGPPAARIRIVVRVNRTAKLGADNVFLVDRKTLSDPAIGSH